MAARPIVITIQGDDSNLKTALKRASKRVKGFGTTVADVGAKAGIAFAATAGAIGVKSVTAFSDFESQVKEVLTLLPDAGEGAFDEISSQVKDFAKEFGALPAEVIPSLYQALSAGVPRGSVFEFLEASQMAAKGGVTDLETAVDGISSVLNSYGDQVEGATHVSDLMATSVRLGKTTFEEMSASLFQVAPIAASLKVPFEAITSSLSVLTAQGVPTSVAAVQIKGALAELGKEGTKADVAFRELAGVGFTQFLEQGGTFGEAITMMKDGSDDLGISVLDMFGSIEAGQAILALTSDGGEAYTEVLGEMQGSAGATRAAFDVMDTGLAAGFDRIKANLSVLAIEIGERLAPYIETATEVVLRAFENLGPAIVQAKEFVIELRDEIADRAVPVLRRIRDVFVEVADKVTAVYNVVAQYLTPGITAAKDAIVGLINEGVNRLISIFNAIDWGAVGTTLANTFETAREAVMEFVRGIPDGFRTVMGWLDTLGEKIAAVFTAAIDWIVDNKTWLITLAGAVGALVLAWAIWQGALYVYGAYLTVVQGITLAVAAAQVAWNVAMNLNPVSIIVIAIIALIGALAAAYTQFEVVRDVVDAVARFFADNILPVFVAFWDTLYAQIFNFWTILSNLFLLVKGLFTGDFALVWESFQGVIGGVIDGAVELFINLPGRLLGALAPLGGQLLEWAGIAMGAMLDFITDKADDLVDLFKGLPMILYMGIIDGAVWLINAGKNIGKKLVEGVGDALGSIADAGKDIVGSLLDGLVDGLSSAVGFVADFAKGLGNAVISFFNDSIIQRINDAIPDKIEIPFAPDIPLPDNPLPMIPNLARGGIATGAGSGTLARIGEAGEPEAIVPLSRANDFGFGAGNTINLTVNAGMGTDPVQVGREIISVLKQWERHNGSIPLTTSAA